ncbi:nucleotidyltransferase family protein [Arthrobacter sp. Z4-13]
MKNQPDETQFSVPEGVLLGHALVSRIADSMGIRAFFIKGPASVTQGLRPPKISADVDVFVAPSDLAAMLQGLRERGWRERPVDPDSKTFPKHSVTVDHPEWPCCIDVHFRFPGMENIPGDTFKSLWADTEDFEVAGQKVRVPSKPLGILILALHALRSPQLPASLQELGFLADLTERESHAVAILDISAATGSLAAIRPFLEDLLPKTAMLDWPEASMEWHNLVMAKEPGSARLIAIGQAPLKDRPRMLFRAVFPRPEVFLGANIYADMSFRGRIRQHQTRWARFLRAAPQVVRDLNRPWNQ